ncbi:MAG TPA: hypothetical protein V6D28_07760 [Leptolyngbyaceae cyanobacterium]
MKSIDSAWKKLEDGRNILAQANNTNNPILLGTALQTIHGSLEDACRVWLAHPNIAQQHQIDVQNRNQASWQVLLDLMQSYCHWSSQDIEYVRKMNGLRNKVAHGGRFEGTLEDVEQYAIYVENILNKEGPPSSKVTNYINQGEQFSPQIDNDAPNPGMLFSPDSIYNNLRALNGKVDRFRFRIKKNKDGIKIICCKTRLFGAIFRGLIRAIGQIFLLILLILIINEAVKILGLSVTAANRELVILIILGIGILFVGLLTYIYINNYIINIFITTNRIYVGKKSYPRTPNTIYRYFSKNVSIKDSWELYFINSKGKVYLARHLSGPETEDIMRILCNADSMYLEPQSVFALKRKKDLIFFSSKNTNLLFVLNYNARLWQRLVCCMKQGEIELSQSDFNTLYSMRLEAWN